MIGFENPELLLLLPIPLILAAIGHRRRRMALSFSDIRLLQQLPSSRRARGARWAGTLGWLSVVLVLILAAANPRTPDLRTRLPARGIAILLVLDVSGSMATGDFPQFTGETTSRLAAAKQTFRLFVQGGTSHDGVVFPGRPTDRIGLTIFSAVPETPCPLTLNHSVLLEVLDQQVVRTGIDAGSNVGDAIAEGVIRLNAAAEDRAKVLILLSDGEHNVEARPGGPLTPRQAAQLAANLGISIHAVDCGGEPDPMDSEETQTQRLAGRATLQAVAAMTGGQFFIANNVVQLNQVYAQIDKLERQSVETYRYRRYHEYGRLLACLAAVLGLLLIGLEATLWRILPLPEWQSALSTGNSGNHQLSVLAPNPSSRLGGQ